MIAEFKKEYCISGTIDFGNSVKLGNITPPDDHLMNRLKIINKFFAEEGWSYRCSAYEALKSFISQELRHNAYLFLQRSHLLKYPDRGIISNASDSLVTRIDKDQQFQAEMKIRLACKEEIISFEVEDNGVGLRQDIESRLFSERFTTKNITRLSKVYIGGAGEHMFYSKKGIEKLQGDMYFVNKGKNQGAIFGYKIPLGALL